MWLSHIAPFFQFWLNHVSQIRKRILYVIGIELLFKAFSWIPLCGKDCLVTWHTYERTKVRALVNFDGKTYAISLAKLVPAIMLYENVQTILDVEELT